MKFHQLRALIALVDKGSIRGAARSLDLSQPALSTRLAELEAEVGAPLVNRTAHGTTLTSVGKALLVHARTIDNHVRKAEEEIAHLLGSGEATVTIGASAVAEVDIVAPLLESLAATHPHIRLNVVEGQFHEMSVALREGALDMVIAPLPPGKPTNKVFRFEELVAYPMHVIARATHPLARCRHLSELSAAKWVAGAATSKTQSTVEELFLAHRLPPPAISVHANAITLVQASVIASDLLALLPPPLYVNAPVELVALPIGDPIPPLRLALISLSEAAWGESASAFAGLVRARSKALARAIASRRRLDPS